MIQRMRSYLLPLALSAIFAGTLGAEFVLQEGLDAYDGCEDASLMSDACRLTMKDEHFKDEYGEDGYVKGGHDNNYDHIPYLFANFCPS